MFCRDSTVRRESPCKWTSVLSVSGTSWTYSRCRLARPRIARKAASLILLFPKSSDSRLVQTASLPTTPSVNLSPAASTLSTWPRESNSTVAPISLKAATASRSVTRWSPSGLSAAFEMGFCGAASGCASASQGIHIPHAAAKISITIA